MCLSLVFSWRISLVLALTLCVCHLFSLGAYLSHSVPGFWFGRRGACAKVSSKWSKPACISTLISSITWCSNSLWLARIAWHSPVTRPNIRSYSSLSISLASSTWSAASQSPEACPSSFSSRRVSLCSSLRLAVSISAEHFSCQASTRSNVDVHDLSGLWSWPHEWRGLAGKSCERKQSRFRVSQLNP